MNCKKKIEYMVNYTKLNLYESIYNKEVSEMLKTLNYLLIFLAFFCLSESAIPQSLYAVEKPTTKLDQHIKAVFHVDELAKWSLALTNIENAINEVGNNADIELVANAEAVKGYVDPSLIDKMAVLASKGLTFVACHNALNSFKIDISSLPAFVKIVPAGVVEIIEKENNGYAYIKP
jgi:intracellular sulfur oxidation DsrE/DsrF family protein